MNQSFLKPFDSLQDIGKPALIIGDSGNTVDKNRIVWRK